VKEGLKPTEIDERLQKLKPRPVVGLVDDDLATLEVLERALHDEGYEIRSFTSAEELLKTFGDFAPDVIVMEAVLPGMGGLAALDHLRPDNIEAMIPVLILSKKDDPGAKLLAFRRGAFDYVTKPFDAAEVAARVKVLVRTKLIQEKLRKFAVTDPLTSVYNECFLLSWLEREIERVKRYGLELSCLLLDVDGFSKINKEKGQGFGDFLLEELASLVAKNTRSSDIVGRLRNDDFLLLLPGASAEQATVVAKRLRTLAAKSGFARGKKRISPSFSIGITGCPSKKAPDAMTFLAKAQETLERAKAVGPGETAVSALN
jgi:diguanylate cyclase (GGDEF)-like protein